jgi:hypothetical protein
LATVSEFAHVIVLDCECNFAGSLKLHFLYPRSQKKGPSDDDRPDPKKPNRAIGSGGRGFDDVWPGFCVAAFKKDKRLIKFLF